jgi:GNAT superfamily N-acetyltransferase
MKIRVMSDDDIPAGVRLKEIAGWNQTRADWRRFLEASPAGCFVAELDTRVCGTVATIVFEKRFAWIGMVLVDPDYRNRGIGTRLLQTAIEYLDSLKIATLKLDATPQGKPLYEKMGFVSEYDIERWILRRAHVAKTLPADAHLPSPLDKAILETDKRIFGADRSVLLQSLHRDAPEFTVAVSARGELQGYTLGRRGAFADHLGPWMATDADTAGQLLDRFLAQSPRETVIVDWLKNNEATGKLLESAGFVQSRALTRMYRGVNGYPGEPKLLCAILGPEFG